ncbi:MAG: hypothetical protein L3J24_05185 [Xanthomonadales bacterium]|nr:hypothetical protein [Xanthomonadales bacterium]
MITISDKEELVMYQINIRVAFTLILLSMFMSLSVIAAEDERTDGIAIAWTMDIVDGKGDAFKDAIKDFNKLYNKKPRAFKWQWYLVMTGPDTGKYIARSANHNWADMDAIEGIWDEELSDFWALNVAPFIENAERFITRTDSEIPNWPEGKEDKFFTLQEIYAESWGDFKDIRIIHETLRGAGAFKAVDGLSAEVALSQPNTATLVFAASSRADTNGPSPSFRETRKTQMGEDELKSLLKVHNDSYKDTHSTLMKYLPEFNETK